MQIVEQIQGAVTVLKPDGPLSAEDADVFARRAAGAAERSMGRLVIDATAVPFADSRGLESLLDLAEKLDEGGRSLRLAGACETLREVLDVTGLSGRFEFYAEARDAVRSFLA